MKIKINFSHELIKMFSLYLLSVIGLISLGVPLSSQANVHASKLSKYDDSLNLEVETETTTTWVSQINISQITPDNDPKTQLLLFYNFEQAVSIQDSEKTFNISNYRAVNAFELGEKLFFKKVNSTWSHAGGSSNVTLTVEEVVIPELDFSNFNKSSRLRYAVEIQTEIQSVFDKEADIENVFPKFPTLKAAPGSNGSSNNLSNYTGIDTTTCHDTLCSSTTIVDTYVKQYAPFGNVLVDRFINQAATFEANKTKGDQGKIFYSRISTIFIDYNMVIGFTNP